ncbi:lysophospholipid acyltransferase family protein [Desulfobacterium sp. N47]|uniref:lysophospholipid acyltransferase family protein n=1 Tax=Desulfobacterium sp. N47 TaxID=3115210 RepID=UPI003CB1351F
MNIEKFSQILKSESRYISRNRWLLPVKAIPGLPSLIYYSLIIFVIIRDGFIARIGKYSRKRWNRSSFQIIKIIEYAGGRFDMSGLDCISGHKEPVVFVSNHMSMLDTFIMPTIILAFKELTFVVKEELLEYPIWRFVMKATKPIAVSRQNPREDLHKVLSEGEACLKSGNSVFIFPQSTRSSVFDPGSFNSLGVKLAKRAGVFVIPVAIKTDFQKNGRLIKDMGPVDPRKTIYIKFGKPLQVEGNGSKTHKIIVDFISTNLKNWGSTVKEAPSSDSGKP